MRKTTTTTKKKRLRNSKRRVSASAGKSSGRKCGSSARNKATRTSNPKRISRNRASVLVDSCRPKKRLRTQVELSETNILICKKESCLNPVTRPEMAYCSRECAPYGNYGLAEDGVRQSDIKQKLNKAKVTRRA